MALMRSYMPETQAALQVLSTPRAEQARTPMPRTIRNAAGGDDTGSAARR